MDTNLIWSIVLAVVGILGIYLAGSKNLWGWVISFSAQVLWIIFAVVTKQYGFILSALAYGWVYGRNYMKWRRESTAYRALKRGVKRGQKANDFDFNEYTYLVEPRSIVDRSDLAHIELVVRKDGSIRERELRMKGYVIGD